MAFISACMLPDGKITIEPKDLPIRVDGTLDFVSANGSTLASILIEIADTPQAQARGLKDRNSLHHHYGMLFVFDNIKAQRFRMLDTRIPLDIIFVGADGCIRNIFQNTVPRSKQIYRSSGAIKYVVEVQGNFTKRFKIDDDACIKWRRF